MFAICGYIIIFMIKGRITRRNFIRDFVIGYFLFFLGAFSLAFQDSGFSLILTLVSLSFIVLSLILLIPSTVKRLHDRDRSGWWTLLGFIPFINLWLFIECVGMKGTPGENRFGPNPFVISSQSGKPLN